MASAAITLAGNPCTIESDTSEAVITNGSSTEGSIRFMGELRNHGSADVWLKIEENGAAASVVTTGAQAQKQLPLPAGSSIQVLKSYSSIAHKCAAGTATLSWMPRRDWR